MQSAAGGFITDKIMPGMLQFGHSGFLVKYRIMDVWI